MDRWNLSVSPSQSKFSAKLTCRKNLIPNLGRNALKLSAGILTSVVAVRFADCDAAKPRNRLDGLTVDHGNPDFDWNAFFELLKPFLKELSGAVVVSIYF